MKYEVGEKVRVVSADSNFFFWTGEIVAAYNCDFLPGVIQYHVRMTVGAFPPLLFKEIELAYAGD